MLQEAQRGEQARAKAERAVEGAGCAAREEENFPASEEVLARWAASSRRLPPAPG